ncbi:MAG: aminotransferase class V-fold PLP-dependent enzyme [Mycoplasmatales bacterium]|nr:aminotransferase class V-fold PLP-dependent enzyme [Mycoplasmatales bacterium]
MNRKDFPLLKDTIFLDSAAGSLKPLPVLDEIMEYYKEYPINTHSVDSLLGAKVMKKIIDAKKTVANLVDASSNEVIFTSGTTDSINRAALMFEAFIKKGDKIILSAYNHSSNSLPWILLAQRTGAEIVHSYNLINDIDKKTKIVAYSQVNNTLNNLKNKINPVELYDKVKENGAILINDAAQAVVTENVSLNESDVIAFSGTKTYGPTGIGVLIIKKELLSLLKPVIVGGGTVIDYDKEIHFKDGISKFEAGSLNVAGIIGMAAGIRYMKKYDNFEKKKIWAEYAHDQLSKLKKVEIISQKGDYNVHFRIKNYEPQDVVSFLGHRNIILRAGKHCATYLFNNMKIISSIRISFGLYTNKEDIDKLVKLIENTEVFIDAV